MDLVQQTSDFDLVTLAKAFNVYIAELIVNWDESTHVFLIHGECSG